MRGLLAVLALLLLPSAASATHNEPLRGEWHLDTAAQGAPDYSTPDTSGHGNTLFSPELPNIIPGRFSNAFQIAANKAPAGADAAPAELEPGRLTLLAWVRNSGDPGNYKNIAAKGAYGCDGASYAIYTGPNESPGLHFYVYDGQNPVSFSANAGTAMWDGNWHLVAGTYDGLYVRVYVDGVQRGVARSRTPAGPLSYTAPERDFGIGQNPNKACGPGSIFPGAIDEVEVYSRALSASELRALVADPVAPQPPPPPADRDGDTIPDAQDNCPDQPNSDQADTDGNGKGNACEQLTAHIDWIGDKCVGTTQTFEGIRSNPGLGPPIKTYTWEARQTGDEGFRFIEDGTASAATHRFGWIPSNNPDYAKAGLAYVRLTVSNGRDKASATQKFKLRPAQSDQPRPATCGRDIGSIFRPSDIGRVNPAVEGKVFTVTSRCRSQITCVGLADLRSFAVFRKSARRRPGRLLARKPFSIPAGAKRKISVKLNKRGRRLLRQRRRLRAKITITSFSPSGKAVKRSRAVTLKLRRRR